MEIKKIIDSGLLETYVMGIATEEESKKVLWFKEHHPEVNEALNKLETDMEVLAFQMAIQPPPGVFEKIENQINEIQIKNTTELAESEPVEEENSRAKDERYIHVESESSHMRIHKVWRWVFAGVFILGKIFLAFAIYFYLESRQAKEQLKELKLELRQKQ